MDVFINRYRRNSVFEGKSPDDVIINGVRGPSYSIESQHHHTNLYITDLDLKLHGFSFTVDKESNGVLPPDWWELTELTQPMAVPKRMKKVPLDDMQSEQLKAGYKNYLEKISATTNRLQAERNKKRRKTGIDGLLADSSYRVNLTLGRNDALKEFAELCCNAAGIKLEYD